MTSFIFYIIDAFFSQIFDFFRYWYKNGFIQIGQTAVSVLNNLDRYFAVKVSIKNLFEPLYQDRSAIGYVLGFVFRLIRIILGAIIYLAVILFFSLVYLIWAAFPIYVALRAAKYDLFVGRAEVFKF